MESKYGNNSHAIINAYDNVNLCCRVTTGRIKGLCRDPPQEFLGRNMKLEVVCEKNNTPHKLKLFCVLSRRLK